MSYGILLLRLVVGLIMAAHGAQKLFGRLGGSGLRATAGAFGKLGFRPPLVMALAAGLAEFGGGLLLAAGLLTPVAGLVLAVAIVNAIAAVHWRNGFWNANGGYEFNLVLLASAVAISATGAARFSVDRLIGWDDNISGLWWGIGVLALSAVFSAATLTLGRRRTEFEAAVPAADTRGRDQRKAA